MNYFVYHQPSDYGDRKGRKVIIVFDHIQFVTEVGGTLEIRSGGISSATELPCIVSCPTQKQAFMDAFINWLEGK
jgi:hypothetical protein